MCLLRQNAVRACLFPSQYGSQPAPSFEVILPQSWFLGVVATKKFLMKTVLMGSIWKKDQAQLRFFALVAFRNHIVTTISTLASCERSYPTNTTTLDRFDRRGDDPMKGFCWWIRWPQGAENVQNQSFQSPRRSRNYLTPEQAHRAGFCCRGRFSRYKTGPNFSSFLGDVSS